MSGTAHAASWALDPGVTYLNHGSFGACPRSVLAVQQEWRARLERNPMRFMLTELEGHLAEVRREIGLLVGADPEDLAIITNATAGVNTVLASYPLQRGDEVLVTSHGYPACINAARYWAERAAATVRVVELPFPVDHGLTVVERVLAAISDHTRLLVIDHVTSPTGLVLPLEAIVARVRARGVATLVDGAHAPGMLPLDLRSLGADYYSGNLHKWCCAPKAAAFLWASPRRQGSLRPLVISHGATASASRFRAEFDWQGTWDPTPVLALPSALAFLRGLHPGGLPELQHRNRALALQARRTLCDALGSDPVAPDDMIGSLAAVEFPLRTPLAPSPVELYDRLSERGFEVPIVPWPGRRSGFVRVSAQAYNDGSQYEELAAALRSELGLT